jgi:carbon monoxide dehydrogenase subunit G
MRFREKIIINRPVAAVWEFLQLPNSEAAWHPAVIEEKRTSAGGLGVGATGIEVRKAFGRLIQFPWEVTEFEPGSKVTTRSVGGLVAWEATYLLEFIENGTRFTFDYRQEAAGLWRLLLVGAQVVMRRQAKSDLVNLKRVVEALRPTGH